MALFCAFRPKKVAQRPLLKPKVAHKKSSIYAGLRGVWAKRPLFFLYLRKIKINLNFLYKRISKKMWSFGP